MTADATIGFILFVGAVGVLLFYIFVTKIKLRHVSEH